jgi:hypothetical protein
MKRACILLLALLLILTGCKGKNKPNNVSVNDVSCPYEIKHKKNTVEITLHDGEQSGISWRVETIPEEVCQVTQENVDKEYTCRYRLSGKNEGVMQLTFTAQKADGTDCFVLTLIAEVDSRGRTVVSSYQHHESKVNSVHTDGLNYKWSVDANGVLSFSFIDKEDTWSVRADEAGVFTFSNMMSTPVGCKFSAQAKSAGQATIVLASGNTQRTIHVVIQAEDNGNIEVISVQEQ